MGIKEEFLADSVGVWSPECSVKSRFVQHGQVSVGDRPDQTPLQTPHRPTLAQVFLVNTYDSLSNRTDHWSLVAAIEES